MNTKLTQKELSTMTVKEINQCIRIALKEYFGNTMKFSVRKTSYNSIRVEVKKADKKYFQTEEEFLQNHSRLRMENEPLFRSLKAQFDDNDYCALKEKVQQTIERLCNSWNYDNSDPYTDYFDVNYYLNVTGDNIEVI